MTLSSADPIATVVIVNYNGAHLLAPCLDGLAGQDMPPGSFRTVVVDNASADASRDLLEESYPEVDLMVSYVNRGFAGGNNVALRTVTTKYAVLLNNDAVPEPDWLKNLLAPLEEDPTGDLVATSSKIVFMPRFVRLSLRTEPFRPGGLDPRTLGVKIYEVMVDGRAVTDKVLFEGATYGPEGNADDQYRWSFDSGEFLVPLPDDSDDGGAVSDGDGNHVIEITVAAATTKPVTFTIGRGAAHDATIVDPAPIADPPDRSDADLAAAARTDDSTVTVIAPEKWGRFATARLTVHPDVERLDVVNNVGGIVFVDGTGGDRGFQEIDRGQYDQAEDVFTACGNGVAIRTEAGRKVGWFDERYFMYYEDVDLSWRLRAAGGRIRYVPQAVLRHIHAASSKPWSPGWLFHVERNRLLTLTKDASAPRAVRGVLHYVGSTGKMAARTVVVTARTRRRPVLAPLRVRGRVLRSYVHLLPGMLAARRTITRSATVPKQQIEKWLVTSR